MHNIGSIGIDCPERGGVMVLLIRRKWAMGAAAFLLLAISAFLLATDTPAVVQAFSYTNLPTREVVILDAGHGGADGGALSDDGTPESGVNLAIVLRLRDFFALMGQETVLTRTDEASLADPDCATLRQQKVSDTKNRVALINSVPNGCLISIHQNTLPGHPNVHGAQVFYGKTPGSDACAETVQRELNNVINADNEKATKPIGKDIYIMAHAQCPALLVECGFLSNRTETAQLLRPEYQTKLAVAIGCGYLQYQ